MKHQDKNYEDLFEWRVTAYGDDCVVDSTAAEQGCQVP